MVKIGEHVTFRSWKAFFDGATTQQGREYLINIMRQVAELDGLIYVAVRRASKVKWQVIEDCTEDSSYIIEDENIFLKADFYDTKALLAAKPVKWYSDLFGELTELRVKEEQED